MRVIHCSVELVRQVAEYRKKTDQRWLCGSAFRTDLRRPKKEQVPANIASKQGLCSHASPAAAFIHFPTQLLSTAYPIRSVTTPKHITKENASIPQHQYSQGAVISCVRRQLLSTLSQGSLALEKGLSTASVGEAGTNLTDVGEDGVIQPRVPDASSVVGSPLETSPSQALERSISAPFLMGSDTFADDKDVNFIRLSAEQAQTLSLALNGASLFVGGKAGTGKSFLLREIVHKMRLRGIRVAVTASTGIAALNIGGNTFHSVFGVPVYQDDEAVGKRRTLSTRTPKAYEKKLTYDEKVLSQVDVILIDEISLLHAGYLEALERAARGAKGKNPSKPFGGVQIILSGDFMQLTSFQFQRGGCSGRASASSNIINNKDRLVCAQVAKECDIAVQYVAIKDALERVHKDSAHKSVERRYCVGYYCALPMYESYAFRNFLLHVQLSESTRHRIDAGFLQDLNLLRVGILTYRLSRSFVLNREDDSAIRLFATRRSVKAYNEQQIVGLNGREVVFKSHLMLLGVGKGDSAGCFSSVEAQKCKYTKQKFWSDVILLHFTNREGFSIRFGHGRGDLGSRRWARGKPREITYSEVQSIVHEICQAKTLDSERFFAYVLPFAYCYSPNIHSVAVRTFGHNRKEATMQLKGFLASASERMQGDASLKNSVAVGAEYMGFMFASAPRWMLIRFERFSAHKFASHLQPRFHHYFRYDIQNDLVTQSKKLKVGCRVMLLRNLNAQYVNGSLGTIVDFAPLSTCSHLLPLDFKALLPSSYLVSVPSIIQKKHSRDVVFQGNLGDSEERMARDVIAEATSTGGTTPKWMPTPRSTATFTSLVELPLVQMDADGTVVAIPWISLPFPGAPSESFFSCRVVCMPLTPAYAFTVHKAQGVTFDSPVLFDAAGMFPCDHLVYVAASRVRCFSQFRSVNMSPRMVTVHVPSLYFSEHLPDIRAATETWNTWAKTRSLAMNDCTRRGGLFSPNWKDSFYFLV
ncbi:unnamed protein product [Phytomonas sp. Hart1]|nr:unnamed protein product [Phytomonas sp. Hart1]|eukprot:CCW70641.1 unnamed protein product [Phytomonas sp. isolate Hart1]